MTILSALFVLLMSSTWGFTIRDYLPNNQSFFSGTGRDHSAPTAYRLSKHLIGDDGRIYACSERTLFAFENNGTIAWTAHLNYTCNRDIAPLHGGIATIYLVAENRVLKINGITSGEVFFVQEEEKQGGGGEIIGISVSKLSSTLYITVKNRGLFAYSFHRQFLWSIGPVINLYGYLLIGCTKGNCYFNSAPVIDYCESQIYISNTQGQVYAVSTRNPRFTWIRDLSSVGKVLCINAGNNGCVYITVPDRALIMALHVSDGSILWQKSVGPLDDPLPPVVVDSNGFISVGSLDGWMYSISPSGVVKKYGGPKGGKSVIQVNPIVDCSGYGIYMSRTLMDQSATIPTSAALNLLVPQTGSIYWSHTYSGEFSSLLTDSDVRHFVMDEQILVAFVAAARMGNPLQCRSNWERVASSCSEGRQKQVSIYNTGNGRGTVLFFLVLETAMLIILGVVVRFCYALWRKRKLRRSEGGGIGSFLEKRRCLLRKKSYNNVSQQCLVRKKKVLDRSVTQLKKKAEEEEEDVVEELEKIVEGREKIKKKLLTTYSLGPDNYNTLLYNDDDDTDNNKKKLMMMKSCSFQDTSNQTIFHPIITPSTSSCSSYYSSSRDTSSTSSIQEEEEEDNIMLHPSQ